MEMMTVMIKMSVCSQPPSLCATLLSSGPVLVHRLQEARGCFAHHVLTASRGIQAQCHQGSRRALARLRGGGAEEAACWGLTGGITGGGAPARPDQARGHLHGRP